MHLTAVPSTAQPPDVKTDLTGTPLTVVFAEEEAIAAVRRPGQGEIKLEPPFHVSDEDLYMVLPSDIGMEVVDILADGDHDLLQESLRDGVIACGALRKNDAGHFALAAEEVFRPSWLLDQLPYAADVTIDEATVATVNQLDHLQCTVLSRALDQNGLERILGTSEYVGPSWQTPTASKSPVDPTHVWSRHHEGGVGIELALFREYDELVIYLKPLRLSF